MPSDELYEWKRTILDAVEARVRSLNREMGIPMPGGGPAPPNPFGGLSGQFVSDEQFATGYDGTVTTVPFTLDLSILTEAEAGSDILTGS